MTTRRHLFASLAVITAFALAGTPRLSAGANAPLVACSPQQPNCHGPQPTPAPAPPTSTQLANLLANYRSGPMQGFAISGNWAIVAYANPQNANGYADGGIMVATHSSGSWTEVTYGAGGISVGELTSFGVDQSDAQTLFKGEVNI